MSRGVAKGPAAPGTPRQTGSPGGSGPRPMTKWGSAPAASAFHGAQGPGGGPSRPHPAGPALITEGETEARGGAEPGFPSGRGPRGGAHDGDRAAAPPPAAPGQRLGTARLRVAVTAPRLTGDRRGVGGGARGHPFRVGAPPSARPRASVCSSEKWGRCRPRGDAAASRGPWSGPGSGGEGEGRGSGGGGREGRLSLPSGASPLPAPLLAFYGEEARRGGRRGPARPAGSGPGGPALAWLGRAAGEARLSLP